MKIYNNAGDLIFEGKDLRGADLTGANLRGANLRGADLRGADLRGAKGLPNIEKMPIKSAIYAKVRATPESLRMSCWHTCETVHCLAGWATVLHPQGMDLEKKLGTKTAAELIFSACEGEVPDFYSDEETAINWLKGH